MPKKLIIHMISGKQYVIAAEKETKELSCEEIASNLFEAGFKLGKLETFQINRFIFNPAQIEAIEVVEA